ncbi:porin family protein [Mesorhizobium sp. M1338]|uniref:outer membrane protein n=1 Tax=unclassified Mesorhizobium TaxID=325217 RepID=UPI0033366119
MRAFIFVASVFVTALMAGTALAADTMVELPVASNYNWTGGYVGAQIGGGWSKVDQPWGFSEASPDIFDQDDADGSGVLGGVHAGYNWQSGSFVFGGEADINATSIDGDDGGSGGDINGFEAQWIGSVRARAGVSFDRMLIYGTGGYAYLHGKADTRDPGREESHSASFNGWTVGAGAEYAITDKITVRGEYRYADFGSKTIVFNNYVEDISPTLQTVTIGFSYRF